MLKGKIFSVDGNFRDAPDVFIDPIFVESVELTTNRTYLGYEFVTVVCMSSGKEYTMFGHTIGNDIVKAKANIEQHAT